MTGDIISAMGKLVQLRRELVKMSSKEKAKASSWFFKTGKGEYGEGDKFIGVTVPDQRSAAKKFKDLSLEELQKLLSSEVHEERLTALFILIGQYERAKNELERENYFRFYIMNLKHINNWDLVDSSAPKIIGTFLLDKKITLLLSLAKSQDIWERRISVLSSFAFLTKKQSKPTYLVCDLLLADREDLIQKAVGWALRECGKRVSQEELENYLRKNYGKMGRTALRYAIERFPENERKNFLDGKF